MIRLFGAASPNVLKIVLMLEEIEQPYEVTHVAVMKGESLTERFLKLNPLGKVPVIIDEAFGAPVTIFESGAILIYLAETYAPALLSKTGPERWETLEWLMVQVAYAGPMLGQLNHFQMLPSESKSYAASRYKDQAERVYKNFEDRLALVPWLGGEHYSIADIAMYPWTAYLSRHGFDDANFPHLVAWRARIDARPSWARAQDAVAVLVGGDADLQASLTKLDIDRFFARTKPGPAADIAAYAARGAFIRGAG